MKNLDERKQLEAHDNSKFIDQCQKEFVETSVVETNKKKVKQLNAFSYIPNAFSVITAGFFIYYILDGYKPVVVAILGSLLLAVVVSLELGKRQFIAGMAKTKFLDSKIPIILVFGILLCSAASMSSSYVGGEKLVTETAPTPPRQANKEIDSLKQVMATEQNTITALQRTTWKGKVTRKATAGMNLSKQMQLSIQARIDTLQSRDDAEYLVLLNKNQAKTLSFGIILGIIAALMDVFLFGLIWNSKRLKYQVAALSYQGHQRPKPAAKTSYQMPVISTPTPPQKIPAMPVAKRPAGFIRYDTDTQTQMRTGEHTQRETRVPRGTQPIQHTNTQPTHTADTQNFVEVTQLTPKQIESMIKRVRSRYARSFAEYNGASKNANTRANQRQLAIEEWQMLEEMGYQIKVKGPKEWNLEFIAPKVKQLVKV